MFSFPMEEEIDVPKADEDTQTQGTTKTPPKHLMIKTPKSEGKKDDTHTALTIPVKWGRLLSLHPALPHVDLVAGMLPSLYFALFFYFFVVPYHDCSMSPSSCCNQYHPPTH